MSGKVQTNATNQNMPSPFSVDFEVFRDVNYAYPHITSTLANVSNQLFKTNTMSNGLWDTNGATKSLRLFDGVKYLGVPIHACHKKRGDVRGQHEKHLENDCLSVWKYIAFIKNDQLYLYFKIPLPSEVGWTKVKHDRFVVVGGELSNKESCKGLCEWSWTPQNTVRTDTLGLFGQQQSIMKCISDCESHQTPHDKLVYKMMGVRAGILLKGYELDANFSMERCTEDTIL